READPRQRRCGVSLLARRDYVDRGQKTRPEASTRHRGLAWAQGEVSRKGMMSEKTIMQEPCPAGPRAFAPTKERVAEFEGAFVWFAMRILGLASAVIYVVMIVKFAPDLLRDLTVAVIVLAIFLAGGGAMLAFGFAFAITFPSAAIVSWIWKR